MTCRYGALVCTHAQCQEQYGRPKHIRQSRRGEGVELHCEGCRVSVSIPPRIRNSDPKLECVVAWLEQHKDCASEGTT